MYWKIRNFDVKTVAPTGHFAISRNKVVLLYFADDVQLKLLFSSAISSDRIGMEKSIEDLLRELAREQQKVVQV